MSDENQATSQRGSDQAPENWEREALREIALAGVKERRAARRWGIFFKTLGFLYLFFLLFTFMDGMSAGDVDRKGSHTALVDVQGIISEGSAASADRVVGSLKAAFESSQTQAVIIRINSPGGSPVQAGYINDAIGHLKEKHPDIPVYAVISDVGASGGYYIAAAADQIYADKASIVGSIGVRLDGFGFDEAIDRLGIERRLLTAGGNKGLMDPFLPVKEEEQAHLQAMLDGIHGQFVDTVKKGRGDRLVDDPEIFSGLVWTGEQSLELGLVDGLGSSGYVAREVIGEPDIVDFTRKQDLFSRLADGLGVALLRVVEQWGQASLR
ncbi:MULTISPECIES: S49 family peptidase [unclassified Ectothiorhodospira]|uniref:S49 family peptidase n=1 Tax=unclassified Ectothiorhodospira TaxID=2684909 RepID=UPI001EE93AAC|nr:MULTISPECIES: S49 family peptidase [unclassified Ectothiorhodospira]MCG5514975.1 S49 family peptidase [Ectothiorhodospira sp. 9100]MCG5517701.1 S49 family peptidase [Ectothiorhodospira sp. 9905]